MSRGVLKNNEHSINQKSAAITSAPTKVSGNTHTLSVLHPTLRDIGIVIIDALWC